MQEVARQHAEVAVQHGKAVSGRSPKTAALIKWWAGVFLVLAFLADAAVVQADQAGPYTYVITNGQAIITKFDPGYSGDLVITNMLGGCPVTAIGDQAFYEYNGLTSVTIPGSVVTIGYAAFCSCAGLTNLSMGIGLITIGENAFDGCSGLGSVSIPETVSTVGSDAFYGCGGLTNVNIGSGVTSIGERAFCCCSNLCSVIIPANVANIGCGAFAHCDSLTNIGVEASSASYSSVDGVLFNKTQTVLVQFPAGKAGQYTIPGSVMSIGDWAFAFCVGLTDVGMGKNVTNVGAWAFSYCSGLSKVVIPSRVSSVGNYAFGWCNNLQRLYFAGDAPSPALSVFYNTPATIYYLPNTTGWGSTYAGRPTVLWNPCCANLSMAGGMFSFTVTGTTNIPVAVEFSTNFLAWSRLCTTNLLGGSISFTDPASGNYKRGFYRVTGW